VGADPPDGAALQQAPERLILHFNEPVSPLVLRLIGPKGDATDVTTFRVRDHLVEIDPPTGLAEGTHVLSWRVISADGHPVGGSLVFSVGVPSGGGRDAAAPQTGSTVLVGIWAARVLLYLGLFVGIGGTFFAAWVAGQPKLWGKARRIIVGAIGVSLAAAGLSVGLQGLDALAAPPGALADRAIWLQGLATTFGVTALVAIVALLSGWLSLNVGNRGLARALSGVALIGAGVALAASGHAGTVEPQWLTRTSVFIHVACLAFWLGALVPLFAMLRSDTPGSTAIMTRFSVAILPVVVVLVVAGVILAVVQLGSVQALWTTPYGNILLLKLLAVAGLLALATANRLVFTPALAQGLTRQRRRFAQSIAAEGALVLLILGLVAGWRFTPPPRSAAPGPAGPSLTAPSEPASVHIHTERGMAEITLNPGRAGRTSAMIEVFTGTGVPLEPKEVTLALSRPSAGIEPLERRAARVGEGLWRVDGLILPVPGRWRVRLDALVTDFDKLTLEDEIEVGP
jgi:copper transport protein